MGAKIYNYVFEFINVDEEIIILNHTGIDAQTGFRLLTKVLNNCFVTPSSAD